MHLWCMLPGSPQGAVYVRVRPHTSANAQFIIEGIGVYIRLSNNPREECDVTLNLYLLGRLYSLGVWPTISFQVAIKHTHPWRTSRHVNTEGSVIMVIPFATKTNATIETIYCKTRQWIFFLLHIATRHAISKSTLFPRLPIKLFFKWEHPLIWLLSFWAWLTSILIIRQRTEIPLSMIW